VALLLSKRLPTASWPLSATAVMANLSLSTTDLLTLTVPVELHSRLWS
jgi:hypothetical protein